MQTASHDTVRRPRNPRNPRNPSARKLFAQHRHADMLALLDSIIAELIRRAVSGELPRSDVLELPDCVFDALPSAFNNSFSADLAAARGWDNPATP
jgi:hypothetical protein